MALWYWCRLTTTGRIVTCVCIPVERDWQHAHTCHTRHTGCKQEAKIPQPACLMNQHLYRVHECLCTCVLILITSQGWTRDVGVRSRQHHTSDMTGGAAQSVRCSRPIWLQSGSCTTQRLGCTPTVFIGDCVLLVLLCGLAVAHNCGSHCDMSRVLAVKLWAA